MTRSSTHIPGVSFSWRRAIGLSALEGKISRETGIPLTRSGREKKMGHIFIHLIGWVLLALIVFPRADLYRLWSRKTILQHAHALAAAWIGVCVILVIIAFATKTSAAFSRAWMILWV